MASGDEIRAGRAYVSIVARDETAAGIKEAESRIKRMAEGLRVAGEGLSEIGKLITEPLLEAAKAAAESGGALSEMSDRTGIAVERLSALQFAAEQTGTNLGMVELGIRRMQQAIGLLAKTDAKPKSIGDLRKEMQELAFDADGVIGDLADLGLTYKDLEGKNPAKQFELIADKIRNIEDPTARAAAAIKVFGRSGTQLIPLINEFEEINKQFEELGLVRTTAAAEQADKLRDAMDRSAFAGKRLSDTFGDAVAPALTRFYDVQTNVTASMVRFVREHQTAVTVVAALATGAVTAGGAMVGLAVAIELVVAANAHLAASAKAAADAQKAQATAGLKSAAANAAVAAESEATAGRAGLLTRALSQVLRVVKFLASPTFLVGTAIGAAAAGFLYWATTGVNAVKLVKDAFTKLPESLGGAFNTMAATLDGFWDLMASGFDRAVAQVEKRFNDLKKVISGGVFDAAAANKAIDDAVAQRDSDRRKKSQENAEKRIADDKKEAEDAKKRRGGEPETPPTPEGSVDLRKSRVLTPGAGAAALALGGGTIKGVAIANVGGPAAETAKHTADTAEHAAGIEENTKATVDAVKSLPGKIAEATKSGGGGATSPQPKTASPPPKAPAPAKAPEPKPPAPPATPPAPPPHPERGDFAGRQAAREAAAAAHTAGAEAAKEWSDDLKRLLADTQIPSGATAARPGTESKDSGRRIDEREATRVAARSKLPSRAQPKPADAELPKTVEAAQKQLDAVNDHLKQLTAQQAKRPNEPALAEGINRLRARAGQLQQVIKGHGDIGAAERQDAATRDNREAEAATGALAKEIEDKRAAAFRVLDDALTAAKERIQGDVRRGESGVRGAQRTAAAEAVTGEAKRRVAGELEAERRRRQQEIIDAGREKTADREDPARVKARDESRKRIETARAQRQAQAAQRGTGPSGIGGPGDVVVPQAGRTRRIPLGPTPAQGPGGDLPPNRPLSPGERTNPTGGERAAADANARKQSAAERPKVDFSENAAALLKGLLTTVPAGLAGMVQRLTDAPSQRAQAAGGGRALVANGIEGHLETIAQNTSKQTTLQRAIERKTGLPVLTY